MVRLVGDDIVIRPLRSDEVDSIIEGRSKLAKEAVAEPLPDREQLRARIRRWGKLRDGRINLAIEVDGRLVGEIQTYRPGDRALPPATYEIGISLYDSADRRKGLGNEAVRLFVEWLFRQGAERVQGGTAPTNHAMRRVFEKLGFVILSKVDVRGSTRLLYGLTRSEWQRNV